MTDAERDEIDARAKAFAIRAHGPQKYGQQPYHFHLEAVRRILRQTKLDGDSALVAAAWLHDVVEDTTTRFDDVRSNFGPETADIVWRVTDEPGADRLERKTKTYPKIKGHRKATIIKLCDRIANVEASLLFPEKLRLYSDEYRSFREGIYVPNVAPTLWCRLDYLLSFSENEEWSFRFWESTNHGLIRERKKGDQLFHPEVIQNSRWVYGSPYVMDAITGMGEDSHSCGETAYELGKLEVSRAHDSESVDFFEINDDESGAR